jgi:hypothetical protein
MQPQVGGNVNVCRTKVNREQVWAFDNFGAEGVKRFGIFFEFGAARECEDKVVDRNLFAVQVCFKRPGC